MITDAEKSKDMVLMSAQHLMRPIFLYYPMVESERESKHVQKRKWGAGLAFTATHFCDSHPITVITLIHSWWLHPHDPITPH
jgi:hypothetical protein